jgi:hypothetical protein
MRESQRKGHKCQLKAMREAHEREMKAASEAHKREMKAALEMLQDSEDEVVSERNVRFWRKNAFLVHFQDILRSECGKNNKVS